MDSDGTQILMFHRVLPNEPVAFGLPSSYRLRGTSLTVEELASVLDDLQGRVIPLEAVETALERGEAPPPGFVLTFDDGYREHLDVVTPMLVERRMVATFYVATGLHGDGEQVAAVDAWYWLLDHAEQAVAEVGLPGGERFRERLDTEDGKLAWVMGPPRKALLEANAEGQSSLLTSLATSVRLEVPRSLPAGTYLRPAEWRELLRQGMRVGAHSVTHPQLTRLPADECELEIRSSLEVIRTLGPARVPFAYPDGDYDDAVRSVARSAGSSSALTCDAELVSTSTNLDNVPRRFVTPAWLLPPA